MAATDVLDSSDDELDTGFVFYKNRPEWSDVKPIAQDEGEIPIVAINYTPEFDDVFSYLRAVLQSGEKSERVFDLTTDAIRLNPANYTVWLFRREVLKHLGKSITEELDFLFLNIMRKHSKNYQVWNHRQVLVDWCQDASQEKFVTEMILQKESKNYHAWQHRQWVIKTFNLFNDELEYAGRLINEDVCNNSAWNYRYFIHANTTGFTAAVLEREIDYTLQQIELMYDNESSWNYLRGLLNLHENGLLGSGRVCEFCDKCPANRFVLALQLDMCHEGIIQQQSQEQQQPDQHGESANCSKYNMDMVHYICDQLATAYDTIRSKYWRYLEKCIEVDAKLVQSKCA